MESNSGATMQARANYPSPPPVFDHLQYEGEGIRDLVTCIDVRWTDMWWGGGGMGGGA